MNPIRRSTLAALLLAATAGTAHAATDAKTKSSRQAEIRTAAQAALDKFYKAEPKIRGEVAAAPGYAVFTTYGLSFMIGGAGGTGLVHDRATKKDTFMNMAQASAGVQIGAAESETLIVFKSKQAMTDFVQKGWTAGVGGGGSAGAAGKSAGGSTGQKLGTDSAVYTIKKIGLQAGGAVEGTKFWKNADLN